MAYYIVSSTAENTSTLALTFSTVHLRKILRFEIGQEFRTSCKWKEKAAYAVGTRFNFCFCNSVIHGLITTHNPRSIQIPTIPEEVENRGIVDDIYYVT